MPRDYNQPDKQEKREVPKAATPPPEPRALRTPPPAEPQALRTPQAATPSPEHRALQTAPPPTQGLEGRGTRPDPGTRETSQDQFRLQDREVRVVHRKATVNERTQNMLRSGEAYNLSPDRYFEEYNAIGETQTYVTDKQEFQKILGKDFENQGRIQFATADQAKRLADCLGLSLGPDDKITAFRLTKVPDVNTRSPVIPEKGNSRFLGKGMGLPRGGPELALRKRVPIQIIPGDQEIIIFVEQPRSSSDQ